MKPLPVIASALILFSACGKSSNKPYVAPPASTRLVSVHGTESGSLFRVDTFAYDPGGNLLMQKEWTYSNGVPDNDTLIVTFTYPAGQQDPSSYSVNDGTGPAVYTVTYDNQGRVARDTAIPDPGGRSSTFTYPNNNIAYSSSGNESADTFYLSSGNVVKLAQASIPFDPNNYDLISFSFSPPAANPFYYTGGTANVRLLLTKIDGWEISFNDCISQYAYTSVRETSGGFAESISISTDASGRVTQESAFGQTLVFAYK